MSLYLKYRPQDFESLVGQGFIKDTLKKAIADKKTVGAYLFTGPRGTGKTSTARIFAKAINCTNNTDGNPCMKCDVCTGFHENKLIDIIEIDAASHTGVDNIREIIEKAQFQPTKTQYKIYIIDEVHMLSKGAFNALLKILEEPPEHVKFILATTEIHKVPETILSRCQRYDFRNHTAEDTRARLSYIAAEESVNIDGESLEYITKTSNGGLRDAISLFEQLIVDGNISYAHIEETLGVSKQEHISQFADKLIASDESTLKDIASLESSWKDIQLFFHDVLIYIGAKTGEQLTIGKDIQRELFVLDTLHDTYTKAKHSFDQYLTFRIGVLKILSSYNPTTSAQPVPAKIAPTTQALKAEKIEAPTTEKPPVEETPVVEQEESLFTEVQDIFATDEPAFESGETPKPSPPQTGDFDTEGFITAVKAVWAKAAITMSLRGSDISLDGNNLTIKAKTKVAFASLENPEAQEFLHKALQSINKTDISIKIS